MNEKDRSSTCFRRLIGRSPAEILEGARPYSTNLSATGLVPYSLLRLRLKLSIRYLFLSTTSILPDIVLHADQRHHLPSYIDVSQPPQPQTQKTIWPTILPRSSVPSKTKSTAPSTTKSELVATAIAAHENMSSLHIRKQSYCQISTRIQHTTRRIR